MIRENQSETRKKSTYWICVAVIGIILTVLFHRQIIRYQGESNSVKCFVWIIHIISLLLWGLTAYLYIEKRISIEKSFLLIAISFGIIYMLIITPLSVPDEVHHYQTAFQLSNHFTLRGNEENLGESQYFNYADLTPHQNTRVGYEKILSEIGNAGSGGEITEIPYPRNLSYAVMYLPQALGISIGRILGTSFLILFYLGRLFNLFFYVLCTYCAIKIVPKHKLLFFGISMMPMAFQQAASYSYDAFVNGMAILYIALFVRALYRTEKMKKWEYLSLLNIGMLLSPAKIVYAALNLLLFLIPKERFGSMKKKILALGGLYGAIGVFLAVVWLPTFTNGNAIVPMEGIEPFTLQFMLAHPLHLFDVLIWSIKDNFVEWTSQAAGFKFSGLTMIIPQYISYIYLIVLLILTVKTEHDTLPNTTIVQKCVYIGIGLCIVVLTLITMLIAWTSQDAVRVGGIQGRYFIPAIPLFLMACESGGIKRKESTDRYLLLTMILLHVVVIDNILEFTINN